MINKTIIALISYIILNEILIINGNRVLELNDKFIDIYPKESRSFLIKFYAPWCHHCQQLEPVWSQVAQQLHNREEDIFVARIDCTKYTSISSHFAIKGFPTIIFVNAYKRVEYRGDRNKEDIIEFAIRVSGPAVRQLANCHALESLRRTHDVFFAYFGQNLNENYSKIASTHQSVDWFYHSSSLCDQFSNGIYVIKANNFHLKYDETEQELEEWIKLQRFAQFVKITNGNFHLLLQTRKYLVIALLEEFKQLGKLNPKHKEFYERMESIAYSYPNQNQFIFGWTSELTTINSIAIRTITPLPNIIVINSTTIQYYLIEAELSSQNIINFLDDIKQNSPKLTLFGGDTFWHRMRRLVYDTITSLLSMYFGNPVLTILLFGLPTAFLSIIIYASCFSDILDAKDDNDITEDDEEEESHEKRD